jgi:uncharacterized membrane protein
MRYRQILISALGFLLGAASNLLADGPTFTAIDFPGAASTQAWGITPGGDIIGFYVSADKATHGFLKSRGEYSSIDFPGASFTEANGISPRGDIIGDYAATLTGSGPHHGFVLSRDGTFTTIDYPGATSTVARGMNSHSDILGTYTSADNVSHIFVMSTNQFTASGQFTTIDDVPGALQTVVLAIHGSEIVGGYTGADKNGHGFVLSDGKVTTIDAPGGAATFTNVVNIDSRGEMVGRYTVNGVTHAYLLSGGLWNTFDYPGATFTGATAISPNGDIVGRYSDANNVFHGFILVGFRLACVATP